MQEENKKDIKQYIALGIMLIINIYLIIFPIIDLRIVVTIVLVNIWCIAYYIDLEIGENNED